jgi:hypothetical protein
MELSLMVIPTRELTVVLVVSLFSTEAMSMPSTAPVRPNPPPKKPPPVLVAPGPPISIEKMSA